MNIAVAQSGGPTCAINASLLGVFRHAVKTALDGKSGIMMSFHRVADRPYNVRIDFVDVNQVANKVKYLPTAWIAKNGHDVTPKALEYFLPLIQGEQNIRFKNGMPQHFILPCALPKETAKNKV